MYLSARRKQRQALLVDLYGIVRPERSVGVFRFGRVPLILSSRRTSVVDKSQLTYALRIQITLL
jgi:hypothetical protein